MASRQHVYNAEFREGAVRIVRETGKAIPQVAEELGINPGTLHSWVSRAKRNGSGAPAGGRTAPQSQGGVVGRRRQPGGRGCFGRRRCGDIASGCWAGCD
ncbi:transposase [Streptomyces yangpuensis]|uniref:transposase n=1 Tax=Streptomyces yangpuensis TaxID=1648182 RepID=UPI00367FC79C